MEFLVLRTSDTACEIFEESRGREGKREDVSFVGEDVRWMERMVG